MKRIFIYRLLLPVLLFFTASFAQQPGTDVLSLKEVIKLTLENHPLLKQKQDELRAAQFRVEQQKSFYFPNISAQLSYTRIGPIPAFSFGGQNLELAPGNNYNFGVFVNQTLYDFGKRDLQVDVSSSFLTSIKDNEELIKNDLSIQAVRAFYGILFIERSLAVKDTQYTALQEHLRITELKIKNGTATDYDVLSTKTKMLEIKNEKIDLLNEKNKQELFLKELIGQDRSKELQITGNFELPENILNTGSLLNTAYNQRPELKMVVDARTSANLQKSLISQIDKPILSGSLGYGFKNGFEPNIEVLRGNWFANVSVGIPIFNGKLTENKINESSAVLDASESKIEHVKQSISTEVYQAEADLKSSMTKISSTAEQIDYAGKSLERAKLQYERGAGTNLEVLDAETSLTQARLFNIQAVYKSIVSYYFLCRAVGDLDKLRGR